MSGIVLDERSAEPLAGATVIVDGEAVLTNVSGQFTVADVEPPYDVAIRASGSTDVRVYRGITLAEPTLLARQKPFADNFASISGTLALADTTTADTVVCMLDGPRELSGYAWANSAGTSPIAWTMSLGGPNSSADWFGENTVDGTIHCVVQRRPEGVLTSAFYGTKAITLADGGDFADQAVPLAEVELATAVAHVTAPAAIAEVNVGAGWMLDNGSVHAPPSQVGAPGEYWLPIPLLSGTKTLVMAKGNAVGLGSSESGVVAPAAGTVEVDLALLVPPAVTSPAADAMVPFTDPIAWTGSGHAFLLSVDLPAGTIEVVTTEERAVLPDLAPFGLGDPTGEASIWLTEYGPATSVDELVDGTAFFELFGRRRDYQVGRTYVTATLN